MPESSNSYLSSLPLAGDLVATDFADWEPSLREEFSRNAYNGKVGQTLLSESPRLRVWEIALEPGKRLPAHRHVLDYMWVATSSGRSRQHTHDGTTREVAYTSGETRHYTFGPGEFLLHDLENIGATTLTFITVELLESSNAPLPLSPEE